MDVNKYYKMTNPQYVNELSSVYSQMYNNTPQEVVEESCNDTAEVIEEQGRKHGSKYDGPWGLLRDLKKEKPELFKKKPFEVNSTKTKDMLRSKDDDRVVYDKGVVDGEGEETSDQYNKGFDAGYAKGYANGLAQSKG
jgi:hypothetical protein